MSAFFGLKMTGTCFLVNFTLRKAGRIFDFFLFFLLFQTHVMGYGD